MTPARPIPPLTPEQITAAQAIIERCLETDPEFAERWEALTAKEQAEAAAA